VVFDSGFWTIARWRGAPIRLHWTIPVGAVLFSGLRFAPAFWGAFFGLILIHELGHAALVRYFKHRVHAIDVMGFGGLCHWSGAATPFQRASIAWGGVFAQAVVLAGTWIALILLGPPRSMAVAEVVDVFTRANLWLIALNLLPVQPLDGAEAWPLFRHLKDGWKNRRKRPKAPKRRASVPVGGPRDSAPQGSEPPPNPEVADMLRRIAEEARRARRGD
jgi:stage IV sporulation protein FB